MRAEAISVSTLLGTQGIGREHPESGEKHFTS